MEFQQSRTFNNLLNAYQSELIAATYYSLNADQARLEGYIEIGNIFDIISRNTREHARIWQRQLNNGILPNTEQNLLNSSEIETGVVETYREYSKIAREEGYLDIASLFNGIANIELNHDLCFRTQYSNILRGEVFCKPEETLWICMQCGNILSGTCAPIICPVCGFPQGYYKLFTNGQCS